jgi:hypothetical protein
MKKENDFFFEGGGYFFSYACITFGSFCMGTVDEWLTIHIYTYTTFYVIMLQLCAVMV